MRIDCHVHINSSMELPESVFTVADHHGVEKICLSSLGRGWPRIPEPEQCVEANDAVREQMERRPERVIGFCYVNPRHGQHALDEIAMTIRAGGEAADVVGRFADRAHRAELLDDDVTVLAIRRLP